MRVLGLDVGSKTIGVAVSDGLLLSAQGLTTIYWDENDMSSADNELKEIIEEYEVSKIVVGLPKHMNGSIGERGKLTQIYARWLIKVLGISVFLIVESLITDTTK